MAEESPQYAALSKYLSGERSQDDALQRFCESVEIRYTESPNADDLEELLWQSWRAVVTIAASTPCMSESRQKLVDFVLDIRKRSTLEKDGQTCMVQDGKVWEELPVLGMEMREAWNKAPSNESTQDQKDQWINLQAFTATLVATAQSRNLPSPDFSLYGIWTIRMALEEEDQPSNVALEAAAVWFIYASKTLSELSLTGKKFDGKLARAGTLFKEREWFGYGQARWANWVRQMEKAGQGCSDDRVASVVADAVKAMKGSDGVAHPRR